MTETTRPAAAGVFVVRDPDVCAALEQLLAPHRTEPAPAPADTSSSQIAALVADAAAVAAELTCDPTATYESVGQMLEHVDARARLTGEAAGRDQAAAESRERSEAMDDRVRRAESAVAHAERDLDTTRGQLQDALARIADLETDVATAGRERELADGELAKLRKTIGQLHDDLEKARKAPPAPRATGSRVADKRAFASLADLMENQARGAKSVDAAGTLRLAARAVRDEIDRVYGSTERKAS